MTGRAPLRRNLQSPAGCEGYLTRQQAARALGFASEFKIRELERKGILHAVRGPMRAAFYPRPEVIAVKAKLALTDPDQVCADTWTDAELLTLLGHPKPSGERRTACDLVLETQISIERALRVCDFWATCAPDAARTVAPKSAPKTGTKTESVAEALAASVDLSDRSAARHERRRAERLSHDSLVRSLRDPDPRVREQAFLRLKESGGL
jgi:hypothetical protein